MNHCARKRRKGSKCLISTPEKLMEEEERGGDVKVQLLKECSFYLNQRYITKGSWCQGQHFPAASRCCLHGTHFKETCSISQSSLLSKCGSRSSLQSHHSNQLELGHKEILT